MVQVEELARVRLLEARPVADVRMLRGEQAEAAVGEDARGRPLELRVLPRRALVVLAVLGQELRSG